MTILGQHIIDFLRFYGPTSVGVLDLVFYDPNPHAILQTFEFLIREGAVVAVSGIRTNGGRPVPAIALKENLHGK